MKWKNEELKRRWLTSSRGDLPEWGIYTWDGIQFDPTTAEFLPGDICDGLLPSKGPTGGSTSYYLVPPDTKDLQDLIEHKRMDFATGNIFKACYRLGEKDNTSRRYDIEKIKWFADRLLAELDK